MSKNIPSGSDIIKFEPKTDKIIEAILYLAHKCTDLSRYRIVKLIYLADKEHLNRFGRPITYDTMVAMKNGPVPSMTYGILKQDKRYSIPYKSLPFDYIEKGDHHYIENPKRDVDMKKLSKTDLRVLDEVIKEHGQKSFGALYDLTHEHKAYKNAQKRKGSENNPRIRFEDMIEESANKKQIIDELLSVGEHIR